MCLYKNTSGGNHHNGNKLMLIWSWGQSSQMPGEFYLFIFFSYWRLLSGAIDLCAEPFVLWSNKGAYWFIGGRQLPFASSSCSLFHSVVRSPGRKSLVCSETEALHFVTARCTSILTLRFKRAVETQCQKYRLGQMDFLVWNGFVRSRGSIIMYKYVCWQNRPCTNLHSGIKYLLVVRLSLNVHIYENMSRN